jgi:hypothetical protein
VSVAASLLGFVLLVAQTVSTPTAPGLHFGALTITLGMPEDEALDLLRQEYTLRSVPVGGEGITLSPSAPDTAWQLDGPHVHRASMQVRRGRVVGIRMDWGWGGTQPDPQELSRQLHAGLPHGECRIYSNSRLFEGDAVVTLGFASETSSLTLETAESPAAGQRIMLAIHSK